jgi:hypothetical protein
MLTIERVENKISFEKIYSHDYVQRYVLNYSLENKSMDEIWNNPRLKYLFYVRILEKMAIRHKNNQEAFYSEYPYETIVYLLCKCEVFNCYVSLDLEKHLYIKYPTLEFLKINRQAAWQQFSENLNEENVSYFFDKITNLTNPLDDRFSIHPTFTYGNTKGFNNGTWFEKLNCKDGKINAVKNMFLDSKIGFIIYFKNKPSIIVSFQILNNNIYIDQIQSTPKDRGHYKIKGDWREFIINYISNHFDKSNINLISPYTAYRLVKNAYTEESNLKITKTQLLNSCIAAYQKPFPSLYEKFRIRTVHGYSTYRKIKVL